MKNNKGFTLVELIIVIAILAIIMLIAIPNFSGIQQRMQVRADKATAAQIGKAVRVWFTDCTTDKALVAGADDSTGATVAADSTDVTASGKFSPAGMEVRSTTANTALNRYEDLIGIEGYISLNQKPSSMKKTDKSVVPDQIYGVFLTEDSTTASAKIVVAIASATETGYTDVDVKTTLAVDYDGDGTGVAYIEP